MQRKKTFDSFRRCKVVILSVLILNMFDINKVYVA